MSLVTHYVSEYPKVSFTTDDNKVTGMGYHTMVATCVLNDGVPIDQVTCDVDHVEQDRFDWHEDKLEIVDKQTNQRNRGAAQWIDEESVSDDVVAMDQYLDKGKVIDISNERVYRANIHGQLTYFTLEPNGKYRRCAICNGRISSRFSQKKYNTNRLYSTEEEADDSIFSE